jgi:hypothetical protein
MIDVCTIASAAGGKICEVQGKDAASFNPALGEYNVMQYFLIDDSIMERIFEAHPGPS